MSKTLKALFISGWMAGLTLSLYTPASAQPVGPTADIRVGDVRLDLSNLFVRQGKFFVIPTQVVNVNGVDVTVGVTGNPDPSLIYSFAATNPLATTLPFAFDFAIPVTPIPAGSSVFASVGYSLTDLAGDGVTLTPDPIAPYLSGFTQTVTGDGIDLGINEGTTFTGTGGGPAFTYTTSFTNSGPSPIAFTTLDLHGSFTLTGLDSAGLTGAVVVNTVPESGTIALLAGLGISGTTLALRRKHRA